MATSSATFLGRAHWIDIALALSDRSQTMGECAHRLGVEISLIRRPVHEMTRRELLVAEPRPPSRGTRYRLRDDLVERAEREAREGQRVGVLGSDQIVFVVKAKRLLDLANALSATDLTRSVVWVAELDAGSRFLLVLDGRNTAPVVHSRLCSAIEASGGTCEPYRAERIMDGPAWRRHLAAIRDAGL